MRSRGRLTGILLLGWIATAVFAGVQTLRITWLESEVARLVAQSPGLWSSGGESNQSAAPSGQVTWNTEEDDGFSADDGFWGDDESGAAWEENASADTQFMKQLVDNALASMMASPEPENIRKTRRQLKKDLLTGPAAPSGSTRAAVVSSAGQSAGTGAGEVSGNGGEAAAAPLHKSLKHPAVDPRSLQLAQQAKEAQKLGDYDRALDLYRQSIETDPANRTAYQAMGVLQKRLGLYEEELATYQQWAERLPEDPAARYLMADAYARGGATDLALQQLELFMGMAGDDLRVYSMAADLYRRIGMPEAEQAVLEQWAAAAPQSPDALNALAGNYRRQGNYTAAEQIYNALLQARPEDTEVRARLSALYGQQGRYPDAIQQLDEALTLRPNDVRLLSQLAEMQRRAGNIGDAISAYEQIIAAQPGSEAAINAERNITRLERQLERAQAQAQKPPRTSKPSKPR